MLRFDKDYYLDALNQLLTPLRRLQLEAFYESVYTADPFQSPSDPARGLKELISKDTAKPCCKDKALSQPRRPI